MTEKGVVGRKTPGDGKLEVSPAIAQALGETGEPIEVRLNERTLPGLVTAMECTCAKASVTGKHVHHFVQCDAFRELPVGSELRLSAERGRLSISL
ncbi:MAG: hypothetical protein AB1762_02790 [Gemmatimonadota bacterium]